MTVDPGSQLDRGHRDLAGALVGHAEHRAVDHGGVAVQHRLDLRGGDLEAAHLDHLLGAVGEVHPALGLQPADITRPVPPVVERGGRGLVGEVAGHGRRALDLYLADAAGLEDGAGVEVDDAQRDAAHGEPGGVEAPPVRLIDRVGGDHGHLTGPVGGEPADAGARRHALGHAGRDRRGAPHDVAERREVVGLEVRVIGHGQRNGGDRHLERHAIFLDAAELLVEIEAAVEPDGRAGRGRGEQVQKPEDVRRWRRHLEAVLGAEPQRRDPVGGAEVDRPVRVPHRLGAVGRPGAEDEHRVVVRLQRDRRAVVRCSCGRSRRRRPGRRDRARRPHRAAPPAGRPPARRPRRSGAR